ncbi:immunoglobulin superfamily member 6 [Dama dama]|uniref:immunoglobulin superfamily member 6 n=1 Tax=Cervus elaphus TaxID=9860 RepID=UPI0018BB9278|nr:immunoglobulin superfamily member 6 [Cervus elaphus]XP_061008984.1 immunoglobulin superfamily member 6 [Dama dama]
METVNRGKIILGLELNLILFYVGVADDCTVSVSQLPELEVDYRQKVVTLTCSFSTVGCPAEKPTRLWFRYGTHEPENLCSNGCSSETDKYTLKYPAQNQVSLTVNRLTFNDSAIYICGIAFRSSKQPRAKQTGGGTVLVVRETKVLSKELQSVLIALLVLFSIYIISVLVILIVLTELKSNTQRKKETEESQKKKSARRIFQEIAQELYNKRHAETSQPTEKDNTYENRTALSNYERP